MKKHNLREKSRLLVEHILNKDFLEANSVLEKLISEAEEDRENAISAEFGFESEEGGDETPNDGGEDVQLDASPEGMSDEDATKTVDDAIGGIDNHDTGIMFGIPVSFADGLIKK